MFLRSRRLRRLLNLALVMAMVATSCGGSDSAETTDAVDVEGLDEARGQLNTVDLAAVVNEVATGIGNLGRSDQRALQGVANQDEPCGEVGGPRAAVQVSQIEVEIIEIRDGCLVFSYDVADFRSFVADLRDLRSGPQVLAASPLLFDYRLNQIESDWPLQAAAATEIVAAVAGPSGANMTVAIIDSGIDVTRLAWEEVTIRRAPNSGEGDYVDSLHGTVAAAVIGAPMGRATRGLAPAVTVLDVPADLCGEQECGCDPCAPMTPAEAIRWSVDNGADIISMSFGYRPAPKPAWWQLLLDDNEVDSVADTLEIALAYAELKDVAMVAAAGNCATGPNRSCETEDQFEIPAGHRSVIGVGALARDEEGATDRAWYSTRQEYVEIAAPGSLVITNSDGESIEKNGTSYATPFAAAAIALLIGDDGPLAGHPDAATIAREILAETATDLAPAGKDSAVGNGQLQIAAALAAGEAFAPANPLGPGNEAEPDGS